MSVNLAITPLLTKAEKKSPSLEGAKAFLYYWGDLVVVVVGGYLVNLFFISTGRIIEKNQVIDNI